LAFASWLRAEEIAFTVNATRVLHAFRTIRYGSLMARSSMVWFADSRTWTGFETDGKKVLEFRAGKKEAVACVEGCL
jgi:hypothetical protein